MTDMTLFAWLYAQIVPPLTGSTQGIITALSADIAPAMRWAIMAYVCTHFLILANTPTQSTLNDMIRIMSACALAYWLVSNAAAYNQYLGNLLLNTLSQEITDAISGVTGAPATGGRAFDQIWNRAYAAGLDVWHNLPWTIKAVALGILVVIYWVIAIACIGIEFTVFVIAQVILSLLVSIGILFVALWPFPTTRNYFYRWLSACLSAVLLQVFTVAILALLTNSENLILTQISSMNGGLGFNPDAEAGQLKLLMGGGMLFFLCGAIAKQLPSIALAVTGGVLADVSTARGIVMSAATAAGGAVSAGVRTVSGGRIGSTAPAGQSLS